MMNSLRHMQRVLAALMIAVWGAIGVVAPAHAAEEDIHHAMQHGAAEEGATTDGQPVDEGSIHPEHAAHCHSGACHSQLMVRGAADLGAVELVEAGLTAPQIGVIPQTHLSSLFRPPRI